jgi:hypothetical protein
MKQAATRHTSWKAREWWQFGQVRASSLPLSLSPPSLLAPYIGISLARSPQLAPFAVRCLTMDDISPVGMHVVDLNHEGLAGLARLFSLAAQDASYQVRA